MCGPWSKKLGEWCPENDGAFQAEQAELHRKTRYCGLCKRNVHELCEDTDSCSNYPHPR